MIAGSDAARYGANVRKRGSFETNPVRGVVAHRDQHDIEQDLACVPLEREIGQERAERRPLERAEVVRVVRPHAREVDAYQYESNAVEVQPRA